MLQLKIISFAFKHTPLKELNRFYLHEENRKERLEYLKYSCDLGEILFLATCNRIEFIFTSLHDCDSIFLKKFFKEFRQDWNAEEVKFAVDHARVYEGENALRHIYRVASSLESMVVGEREIITQVRNAYDTCRSDGMTGDLLRLVVKSTITTAKQVYTDTKISINPVSVVSLAERELRQRKLNANARIVMVGAGETNSNLAKYLVKQGFNNFSIFNRTISNSKKLAAILASDKIMANGKALDELKNFKDGFDVLIVCTAAPKPIINSEVYTSLLSGDDKKKIIIDLSIPSNIDAEIYDQHPIDLIDVSKLIQVAEKNMVERRSEVLNAEEIIEENVAAFRHLHRTRMLEVKMRDVPEKIRQIKDKAVNDIFANDINTLDDNSREVLGRVLDYMEKKCISVPMIMAKEIILETSK